MSEDEDKESIEGEKETPTEDQPADTDQVEEKSLDSEDSEPKENSSENALPKDEDVQPDEQKKAKEETAEDLLKSDLDGVKVRKAKGSKNIASGVCHVLATFNNTKVTFSDPKGNVISWSSSGKCNFRGSRKSTAYAAQVVTQDAGRAAMSHGMKEVVVKVKGPGMGRDSAVRTLQSLGFIVTSIIDVTPVPHNGCRPPKRRRV